MKAKIKDFCHYLIIRSCWHQAVQFQNQNLFNWKNRYTVHIQGNLSPVYLVLYNACIQILGKGKEREFSDTRKKKKVGRQTFMTRLSESEKPGQKSRYLFRVACSSHTGNAAHTDTRTVGVRLHNSHRLLPKCAKRSFNALLALCTQTRSHS